ncbi:hypothetical protein EMGBS15_15820 [Filimonas sp.]|nr:hypothetical protein EMGBS15_15820 [Filimonas sp.]
MKPIFFFCLFILSLLSTEVNALPPAYAFRVKFKDKNGTLTFADSLLFLTQKSLDRRSKQGLTLDSTDLPVVPAYINQVMTSASGVLLHNVSKWFNQIVVITIDSTKVTDIAALPMVESVKLVARYPNGVYKRSANPSPEKYAEVMPIEGKRTRPGSSYYGLAYQQINIMHGDYLHDNGFKGEGMDIAVFDVNFRYTNTCNAFDSLSANNQIKDVFNFAKDTAYVYSTAIAVEHGMNVLGCMAGNIPGTYVGTAPNANFYLYITEDWLTEQPIEEDNWLSAAERADSLGVYLVNSSLGYNIYTDLPSASYTYTDMNGQNSLIARAANKAVSKGIFIVNAQGNEGASAWHYMLTPADADSVYSVGSVDGSGLWAGSGYGPTFDGRIKPDGCAMGKSSMLIGGNCLPGTSNGSSFASPMLCGSIACLWQSTPSLTAFQLRRIVRMCSDHYTNPNNTIGYGVPNFELAHSILTGTSEVRNIDFTFSFYPNPCDGHFTVRSYDPSIENVAYSLYDLSGKLIYRSEKLSNANFSSDALEQVAAGEYVLLISTFSKTYSTRIMRK